VTAPSISAEGGAVLGEPGTQMLLEAVGDARVAWSQTVNPEECGTTFIATRLLPVVAALVAQARTGGDGLGNVKREDLGRVVREEWIAWARQQSDPKPSWLVPWEELPEPDREVDRRIGERLYGIGRTDGAAEKVSIDEEHLARQREWSRRTFGPGRRTLGLLDHIRKELAEIEGDPLDVGEWVDVIILAFDGAWRAGWEPQEIIAAVKAKQARNEARVWPDWRGASEDVAIEHDRSVSS